MKFEKEVKKQNIKAIVFDVGGVLQLEKNFSLNNIKHLGIHEFMAKKFKIDLDTWFDLIDSVYADSIEGIIPRKKSIKILSKNLKVSSEKLKKLFNLAYKSHFKKNKRLYNFAYKLKSKGYIIGILSDQWYLSKDVLMPKKDIKNFDLAVVSCDVGLRKPNIKIYKLLIKRLRQKSKNIKFSEILFIDNREWNLKPAKRLGIKTILFKNNGQLTSEINKFGINL